jgi:ABC-type amino acid transport substrate-binding protein
VSTLRISRAGIIWRWFGTLSLMLLLALTFLVVACQRSGGSAGSAPVAAKETVYQRVIRTGVIRAAYLTYPPALMKDTATGKLSGIFYETLERIASNSGLKVEWTEEVGWGSQIEGLNADRYDIVGSPVWANPTRGRLTTMSRPVYYSGIGIYVRKDDKRFDANVKAINDPKVKIATIDGETGDLIARTSFPQAQRFSNTQLTDISQLFLEVSGRKADLFFAEPYFAYQYFKNNPQDLRNIAAAHPIRVLGNCYMFKANEFQLKQLIDTALEDLLNSGYIDELLAKHDGGDTFYRVALPYQPKQ